MPFFTTEVLSPKRQKTPEGFLLCLDVPLARTGMMEYGPGETPITPANRSARIYRRAEDVFAEPSLASYTGKPLVNDHPDDDVTPVNWRDLADGIILNPRRGDGEFSDCILGDILVTDPDAIQEIEANDKLELSAGYDADYEQTGPGEGLQKNIIINHVARVNSGRCGPRCRIGDQNPKAKEKGTMSTLKDLLTRAFKAKDAADLESIEKEAEGLVAGGSNEEGGHHVHVHLPGGGAASEKDDLPEAGGEGGGGGAETGEGARIAALEKKVDMICAKLGVGGEGAAGDKKVGDETEEEKKAREEKEAKDKAMKDDETIEGALEMEAPPGTGDKARKARDSAYLGDAWQTLVAQIEIITPGARMPTFDSASRPAVTYSKICGMRSETLAQAYRSSDKLRGFIDSIGGGSYAPDFKGRMTCDAARMMIGAVATEAARHNNAGSNNDEVEGFGTYAAKQGSGGGLGVRGAALTPADLNKAAAKLYGRVDA